MPPFQDTSGKFKKMLDALTHQKKKVEKATDAIQDSGPTPQNIQAWNAWSATQSVPLDFNQLLRWQSSHDALSALQETLNQTPSSEWMNVLTPVLEECESLQAAFKKIKSSQEEPDWPDGSALLAVKASLVIPAFQESLLSWALDSVEEQTRIQIVEKMMPLFPDRALNWAKKVPTAPELMACLESFFQIYPIPQSARLPRFEQLENPEVFNAFVELWKNEHHGPIHRQNGRSIAELCFSMAQMHHLNQTFSMNFASQSLSKWVLDWYANGVNLNDISSMADSLSSQGLVMTNQVTTTWFLEWVDLVKKYDSNGPGPVGRVRNTLKYKMDQMDRLNQLNRLHLLLNKKPSWEQIELSLKHEQDKEFSYKPQNKTLTPASSTIELLTALAPIFKKDGFFDHQDLEGWTLLHHLVLRQKENLVQWALDSGADPMSQTPEGLTPRGLLLSIHKALEVLRSRSTTLTKKDEGLTITLNENLLRTLEKEELTRTLPAAQGSSHKTRL